jgi:hypothetical protein
MNRPGRPVRILSIVAYTVAGLLAADGIIVGLGPYNVAGFDAVCPSALGHLPGAVTPLQSVPDRLASAPCAAFEQMTALMFILLGAAVIALVAGLMTGSWAGRLRPVPPRVTGRTEAVAEPTHFPLSTQDQDAAAAPSGPPASED